MMQSTLLADAYFRFIKLLETLEDAPSLPKLDCVERRLIEFIALHEVGKKPLLVSDVIYLNSIASPATLHRRISYLVDAGYIRHGADIDGRKKYLELTPKAMDYFSKLGKCIVKAAQAGKN